MTNHKDSHPALFNKPLKILRYPEVRKKVPYSRSQIHNLVNSGEFPPPIKLGKRASGWIESEIDEWIEARISKSRRGENALIGASTNDCEAVRYGLAEATGTRCDSSKDDEKVEG